jgi:hypothetical protein
MNGILRYRNMVWIRDNPKLRQHILEALHALAIGGHSGFQLHIGKLSVFSAPANNMVVKIVCFQF